MIGRLPPNTTGKQSNHASDKVPFKVTPETKFPSGSENRIRAILSCSLFQTNPTVQLSEAPSENLCPFVPYLYAYFEERMGGTHHSNFSKPTTGC